MISKLVYLDVKLFIVVSLPRDYKRSMHCTKGHSDSNRSVEQHTFFMPFFPTLNSKYLFSQASHHEQVVKQKYKYAKSLDTSFRWSVFLAGEESE